MMLPPLTYDLPLQISHHSATQTADAHQADVQQSRADRHLRLGTSPINPLPPSLTACLADRADALFQILIFSLALLIYPNYHPLRSGDEATYTPTGGK